MFFHNGWLWYRHAWLSPEPSHSLESLLLHFPAYCFGSDACSASRTHPWRYRTGAARDLDLGWKAGTARVFHSPMHVGWQKASIWGHGTGINWRQPAMSQIYPRDQTSHQMRHKTGTSTSLLCITTPAAALGCQSLCEPGCKMQDVHMERAQNCITEKKY